MSVEVVRLTPEGVTELYESFYPASEREALRAFYGFPVIWQEEVYDFAARDGDTLVGGLTLRVAASLGHVERVVVAPEHRRSGIGRALLVAAAEAANYYNCHKMTVLVPHHGEAQQFFEACDYHEEAVLPQHTFKLDMAMLRKFLL